MNTEKKKRVLEVITLTDSAVAFIGDQFSYFQQEGNYEMHLICSLDDKLDAFANRQGIKYCPVEISRTFSVKADIKAIFAIRKYIKENKIDIVVAHYFPKACFLTILACLFLGVKHKVIIAHGVLHDTMHGLLRKAVIWEQKWDVWHADKVVCVSPSVARRRREDGIEKAKKQTILGMGSCNGVDTINKFNPSNVTKEEISCLREKYGLDEDTFVIGFNGRLVHDKGVNELVAAYKDLLNEHPDRKIKLLVIGEPETRDALPQETIDFLETSKDIVFTGWVQYADIQKYYMLMDMLVLPSYREGFPTVILEAGAMGVPVAVSKSTGCIDSIKDGVTGIYIDINSNSIKQGIEKYFDEDFRLRIGKQARVYVVKNFDQRIIRKYMLDVLNSLD